MRLEQFSIQQFRSIIKAEKLRLGDLTVLVGPNNEGKSNILEALAIGMQELATPPSERIPRTRARRGGRVDRYDWERDFPQPLQDADPNGRTIMRFDFQLTPEEVEDFYTAVKSKLNGVLPIQLTFGGGRPTFSIRKQKHSAVLSAKRTEIAQFVRERVQVQHIPAVRSADVSGDIVRSMVRRQLVAAQRDPIYEQALEQLRQRQHTVLDALSTVLSAKMKELLPEVKSVTLDMEDRQSSVLGDVRIIVDDGTATDLELKGDGVQSLTALSVIQHYSTETARAKEFILAVEEPESHLHPEAIHALRSVLLETSSRQQVVLTTHSPLFVNRIEIGSNIIVERNRARAARSVAELRDVLGVRITDNLEGAEVILVVEGKEDKDSLTAILSHRSAFLGECLVNGTLRIYPLTGGDNLGYVLALLRDSLATIHVFLDADQKGKECARAAEDAGLLSAVDCSFTVCSGARESEFEDLIDPEVYRAAMKTEFGVSIDHTWMKRLGKGKWSARMPKVAEGSGKVCDAARLTEYKAVVAREVAANPGAAVRVQSDPVIVSLVEALTAKLNARTA